MQDERRKAPRHVVEVRVEFDSGYGLTRDVSGVGVSFETTAQLERDQEIEFTLLISDNDSVRCLGRVVRVAPATGGMNEIAATILRVVPDGTTVASETPHLVVREIRSYHPEGWEWGE